MFGSLTAMSPAWLAVSFSAASGSSLRGRVPPPKPPRADMAVRAVHPLDHAGLDVLLIDHRRIVLADQLVLVQLLDGVQVGQRGVDSLLRCSVDLACGRRHYAAGPSARNELPTTMTMVRSGFNVPGAGERARAGRAVEKAAGNQRRVSACAGGSIVVAT